MISGRCPSLAGKRTRSTRKRSNGWRPRSSTLSSVCSSCGAPPRRPAGRTPDSGGKRAAAFLLLAAVVSLRSDANVHHQFDLRAAPPSLHGATLVPDVWIVEENRDFETYSNGLRIENRLAVANEPRSYSLIAREGGTHRRNPASAAGGHRVPCHRKRAGALCSRPASQASAHWQRTPAVRAGASAPTIS